MTTSFRRAVLEALQRLGVADTVIDARDAVRRRWHSCTDTVRLAHRERAIARAKAQEAAAVVKVEHDGSRSAVAARIRTDHRASVAIARNRDTAEQILVDAGLAPVDVGGDLLVCATARSLLDTALASARVTVQHQPAVPREQDEPHSTSRSSDIVVYEHTVSDRRTALYQAEYGCRIRFVPERVRPEPSSPTITFPIDVVYTWVDGEDEGWRRKRESLLNPADIEDNHPEAASRARFESLDELRYSLRSIERFAEFVRHVYIVTDDQRPSWLDAGNPRLSVIDHRAIFPDESYLPVFNSHAIEARLHHIPGLADNYLYLNDDFLFGRGVEPEDFFESDGRPKVFASSALTPRGPVTADTKPVDAAAINVRELIRREYGVDAPPHKFKHAPYAQHKAVYAEIERRFAPELDHTARSRIRSSTDVAVASSLHQHVALVTGMGSPGTITSEYADLGQSHLRTRLERLRRTPLPSVICMNDSDEGGTPPEVKAALVRQFFDDVYPDKSAFEL